MLLIGEHKPFSHEEKEAIDKFAETNNVFVYANNISNYHGKYAIQANLLATSMTQKLFEEEYKPDIVVTIGGLTGDYGIYHLIFDAPEKSMEVWRIAEDGNVVDTYKKLTKIFECNETEFFSRLTREYKSEHSYFEKWQILQHNAIRDVELVFSNVYAAQQLYKHIPKNSYLNFAIHNSLRSWLWFPTDDSIKCFSNVAAFGIDGCMSMLIGESVEADDLCFMIVGDLSFYYDMNSIGIRHIKNNVHILLVNNNGGLEFKLGNLQDTTDVGTFIAADNHFKNAKGWAETEGFIYLSAHNKEEFKYHEVEFVSPSEKPIIFEIFTTPENEKEANCTLISSNRMCTENESRSIKLKQNIRSILGNEATNKLKKILKK